MLKDLFQMDFALSLNDRMEIIAGLKDRNMFHPHCSLCGSGTDIGFMRKPEDAPVEEAVCLPCFLQNHTDSSQDLIDKIVQVGEMRGWYHD